MFVREDTQNGQRFVDILGPDGIELPSSDGYFVRYWQAGERIDTPCVQG